MSRAEENKLLIELVASFQDRKTNNLDDARLVKNVAIASALLDISKSLAIIADSMDKR